MFDEKHYESVEKSFESDEILFLETFSILTMLSQYIRNIITVGKINSSS